MNTKLVGAIALCAITVGPAIAANLIFRRAESLRQMKKEAAIKAAFKDAGLNGELRFTHTPEFSATYTSFGETINVAYYEKVPELLQSTINILKLFEAANKKVE